MSEDTVDKLTLLIEAESSGNRGMLDITNGNSGGIAIPTTQFFKKKPLQLPTPNNNLNILKKGNLPANPSYAPSTIITPCTPTKTTNNNGTLLTHTFTPSKYNQSTGLFDEHQQHIEQQQQLKVDLNESIYKGRGASTPPSQCLAPREVINEKKTNTNISLVQQNSKLTTLYLELKDNFLYLGDLIQQNYAQQAKDVLVTLIDIYIYK